MEQFVTRNSDRFSLKLNCKKLMDNSAIYNEVGGSSRVIKQDDTIEVYCERNGEGCFVEYAKGRVTLHTDSVTIYGTDALVDCNYDLNDYVKIVYEITNNGQLAGAWEKYIASANMDDWVAVCNSARTYRLDD